jgi:hypothetical protein
MPIDVVQIQRGRWSLRNVRKEFDESSLFHGGWGALTQADILDGLDVEYEDKAGRPCGIRRYHSLAPVDAAVGGSTRVPASGSCPRQTHLPLQRPESGQGDTERRGARQRSAAGRFPA